MRGTDVRRESNGDNIQDTNGDYQVRSCRDAEMWRCPGEPELTR